MSIGRKSRLWTAAQDRAIRDRDQHCQFYGCTETRYLQIHHEDISMFDFEKQLRNNRDSFNTVRKLSPTRYRFRVLDPDGNDIRAMQSTRMDCIAEKKGKLSAEMLSAQTKRINFNGYAGR